MTSNTNYAEPASIKLVAIYEKMLHSRVQELSCKGNDTDSVDPHKLSMTTISEKHVRKERGKSNERRKVKQENEMQQTTNNYEHNKKR